jgi:hypothetical protein
MNNFNREEYIELLSASSNFEKDELSDMSDTELKKLWSDMEMDEWLDDN